MKPLFRRGRTKTPEGGSVQDRVDPTGVAGALTVELAVQRPVPTFVERLEASGDETPTAFIRRLMIKAHAGEAGATDELLAVFDALPPHSRVSVAPVGQLESLPTVFFGTRYNDTSIGESGISALKSDGSRSEKVRYESHVDMQLDVGATNWKITYRAGMAEWRVSLPFDEAGEPQFRFDVTLPEAR